MAFVRHSNGKFAKKSSNIRLKKLEASRIRRFSKSHIITEHDYNILPGTLPEIGSELEVSTSEASENRGLGLGLGQ